MMSQPFRLIWVDWAECRKLGTSTEEDETPAKKAPEETAVEPPSAPVKPKTRNAGIKGIEK
jgi:hypothetical protein